MSGFRIVASELVHLTTSQEAKLLQLKQSHSPQTRPGFDSPLEELDTKNSTTKRLLLSFVFHLRFFFPRRSYLLFAFLFFLIASL
jgi:hypothetical protein